MNDTTMSAETIVVTLSRSCSWCPASVPPGPVINGPRRARAGPRECACGPQAAARPGARPGPGPGHWGRVCYGPVRRRGLAELADDVMVVAVVEDARLIRLIVDDVIDHDGQVVIASSPRSRSPNPLPRC